MINIYIVQKDWRLNEQGASGERDDESLYHLGNLERGDQVFGHKGKHSGVLTSSECQKYFFYVENTSNKKMAFYHQQFYLQI